MGHICTLCPHYRVLCAVQTRRAGLDSGSSGIPGRHFFVTLALQERELQKQRTDLQQKELEAKRKQQQDLERQQQEQQQQQQQQLQQQAQQSAKVDSHNDKRLDPSFSDANFADGACTQALTPHATCCQCLSPPGAL